MFSVLIVDDEPYVVHEIEELLNTKCSYELDIYCAYHAAEALQILQNGRIDLLLCDIVMPGMTGLELQEKVRQLWPLCKTVFISAMADFQYAYKAMSIGAAGYILKSESDDKILAYIENVLLSIDAENIERLRAAKAERLLYDKQSDISRYFLDCLEKPQRFIGEEAALASLLHLEASKETCIVISPTAANGDTLSSVHNYLAVSGFKVSSSLDKNNNMIWIVQSVLFDGAKSDKLALRISEVLDSALHDMSAAGIVTCSFLISEAFSGFATMPSVYRQMTEWCCSNTIETNEPYIQRYSDAQSIDHFDSASKIVGFLREYIDKNIAGDVSLMKLSSETGYNSSYISRLFHNETGQLLSNYISRCKLKYIMSMMEKGDKSLDAIALSCGFTSRSYFNRFVKRMSGLSPQLLREQCLNGNKTVIPD